MTIRPAGINGVAVLAMTCLAAVWPPIAGAQVKLAYKFPEGRKLTYTTTSRTRQVLTLMGTQVQTVKKETKGWFTLVGKRRGDSTLPIEKRVQSLRVEYTLPGELKLTLDSGDSHTKVDNSELAFLADEFKLESTVAYVVVLDSQTKVKAIEGADQLQERADKLDTPIAREEARTEFTPERLKTKFEQAIQNLPDGPARAGESWERGELLDISGKTFTIRKKYEYRGPEKKGDKSLEKISYKVVEAKYDQDPKTKLPLKVVKSDLKVESSDGTILFDREEGHVVSASERIRFKGEMTYSGGGVDQSGAFELTLDVNTQLQPVSK